jgi:hypothetical protein
MEAYQRAIAAMESPVGTYRVSRKQINQMRPEPCAQCLFILFCKKTAMTCPAFRAYVAEASRSNYVNETMVPDKSWDDSFDRAK